MYKIACAMSITTLAFVLQIYGQANESTISNCNIHIKTKFISDILYTKV